MTVPVQIVHGNVSHKSLAGAVLRDGSQVSGRVISQNQNGSYSVSIAGQMIEVKSEAKLTVGQNFQAKVKIAGNQVQLSLVQDTKSSGELIQKFAAQNQNLSPQIQQFLSSLGFEPSMDSFKIVQFMQQIGIKIDVESSKKALAQSKKNGVVSEEKAQVSFLLKEKGIAFDDEKVSAILGKNPHDSENGKRKNENGKLAVSSEELGVRNEELEIRNEKLGIRNEEQGIGKREEVLRFARNDGGENLSVRSVRDFFSQVDSAALSHKNGVLSAFNTILSKNKENAPLRHWIVLPFEWDFQNYAGNIKLLFDSELKNLQKAIIELKNSANQHIFSLGFEKNLLKSVKCAFDSERSENAEKLLQNLLFSHFGRKIPVEWADFSELRGFCADDEVLALVQGVV